MGSLLTNGYGVGVEGKNLVLKTQGRVYIKVKDRFYELKFKDEDLKDLTSNTTENTKTTSNNVIFVDSSSEVPDLEYPGDNYLIISLDGTFWRSSDNTITQIPLTIQNPETLTLTNLIVNGTITLNNTSEPPIIINNNVLIPNLNADFLDGKDSTAFAQKSNVELIDGNWTFAGKTTFNNSTGLGTLTDSTQNRIYIDFNTGTIRVSNLEVLGSVTLPEENGQYNSINGTNGELWVGAEYLINTVTSYTPIEDEFTEGKYPLTEIQSAFDQGYLSILNGDDNDINIWYNVFCLSYDLEDETATLKDLSNLTLYQESQALLTPFGLDLADYMAVYYNCLTPNITGFDGTYYKITPSYNIKYGSVCVNDIIKDTNGNLGVVVNVEESSIIVKSQDEEVNYDIKFVIIGNQDGRCGICFKSNGENTPYLVIYKDPINQSDPIFQAGNLQGLSDSAFSDSFTTGIYFSGRVTKVVNNPTVDEIKNAKFPDGGVYIKNPAIKFNEDVIFNPDSSGYIANGIIRWISNKLYIDGADIINSRINNTGITNSSFQSGNILINTDGSGNIGDKIQFNSTTVTLNSPLGPAGGDLTGQYPNPTINDGAITTSKIADKSITQEKLTDELWQLIEQAGGGTDLQELKDRITTLENTVGTLNTTLENRLNGN